MGPLRSCVPTRILQTYTNIHIHAHTSITLLWAMRAVYRTLLLLLTLFLFILLVSIHTKGYILSAKFAEQLSPEIIILWFSDIKYKNYFI